MGGNRGLRGKDKRARRSVLSVGGTIVEGQCWIDVVVRDPFNPGQLHGARALIDTGATDSSISTDFAAAAGITGRGRGKVATAGGPQDCDVAQVEIGFLLESGTRVYTTVAAMILPMGDIDVLFGMHEIAAGRLVVDGPAFTWSWDLAPQSVNPDS